MGPGIVPTGPFLCEGVGMSVESADSTVRVGGDLGEWDGPFLVGGRQGLEVAEGASSRTLNSVPEKRSPSLCLHTSCDGELTPSPGHPPHLWAFLSEWRLLP